MTNAEFQHELRNLHTRTLEEGPNWREVALITADELAAYVRHTTQYEDDIPAAMAAVTERMKKEKAKMIDVTPDTSKMLFYPHDGELEGGAFLSTRVMMAISTCWSEADTSMSSFTIWRKAIFTTPTTASLRAAASMSTRATKVTLLC